jgi:hypothetical protein
VDHEGSGNTHWVNPIQHLIRNDTFLSSNECEGEDPDATSAFASSPSLWRAFALALPPSEKREDTPGFLLSQEERSDPHADKEA